MLRVPIRLLQEVDSGPFPNLGVSIVVLRKVLNDDRMRLPFCRQTFVSTGKFGTKGEITSVPEGWRELDEATLHKICALLQRHFVMRVAC